MFLTHIFTTIPRMYWYVLLKKTVNMFIICG